MDRAARLSSKHESSGTKSGAKGSTDEGGAHHESSGVKGSKDEARAKGSNDEAGAHRGSSGAKGSSDEGEKHPSVVHDREAASDHPRETLRGGIPGAVLEPFCGHLSPKIDKVS